MSPSLRRNRKEATVSKQVRVGIDAGGTSMSVGVFPAGTDEIPRALQQEVVPVTNNLRTDIAALGLVLHQIQEAYGEIVEVGFDAAGRFNPARTELYYAGNLTGWVKKPLVRQLVSLVPDARWVFGNDVEAQALYEALHNPALKGVDFVMWAVGTGIGTARVTWDGDAAVSHPMEAQHFVLAGACYPPNPEICGCGQYGCVERLGSGSGAQQRFGRKPEQITPGQWDIVARDQAGGLAVILTMHLVDTIVYGGGVAERQPQLRELVQTHLNSRAVGGVTADIVPASCTKLDAAVAGLTLLWRGQ